MGLLQLDPCALRPAAETQPSEGLQVTEVVTQQAALQAPSGRQLPQTELHLPACISAALQVAVERGHPEGTAGLAGPPPLLIQLLQRPLGELNRLGANGVKAHNGSGASAPGDGAGG